MATGQRDLHLRGDLAVQQRFLLVGEEVEYVQNARGSFHIHDKIILFMIFLVKSASTKEIRMRWKQRPEGSNWGDFGPDDQRGCLNYITPQSVLKRIRDVREGLTFCLYLPRSEEHPSELQSL